MKAVGIVVEYNPLHNGHVYHFEQARHITQKDAVVAVMSGHFLQRGEPALVNKWARTEMALSMGADIVIELPYAYATQHARIFAYGAVYLLNALPFVEQICFGSEGGEIEPFQHAAQFTTKEPPQFQSEIQRLMKQGLPYPRAYASALRTCWSDSRHIDPSWFEMPNNILGLHYVNALYELGSSIKPTTIRREKAGYHQKELSDKHIASATAIRKALFSERATETSYISGQEGTDHNPQGMAHMKSQPHWSNIHRYVPEYTLHILKREHDSGRGPVQWEDYFPYVLHALLSQSSEQLRTIYEMEEGMEYRLKAKAKEASMIEELIRLSKSKRYTWNRLQRMLLHTFTQLKKDNVRRLRLKDGPDYIRLLGFSEKGRTLLSSYKKHISLPLISAIHKEQSDMLEWDLHVSRLYTLGYRADLQAQERERELQQSPLIYPTK
jgi:predicted nucleotidyltransferase